MEIDLKEVGRRIYQSRISLGMTQEKLAEMMDVSIQMISNLERGNKEIKISNLVKLSSILGVSTDYILTGREFFSDKSLSEKLTLLSEDDVKMVEYIIDRLIK